MSAPSAPSLPSASPTAPSPRKVSTLRSASLVAFMTLLSRLTGMLQSRLLARYLGVGLASDAFVVAFRIPNLLRRFAAEGTMTSAFLPTVNEVERTRGETAVREMVARFLGTLGLCLLLLSVLAIIGMSALTGLQMLGKVAPGTPWWQQPAILFQVLSGARSAPPGLALTTLLARIMFPYLALVSLTAGLSAVLNLRGRFGLPASVSTFWNLTFLAFGYGCLKLGPAAWRSPGAAALVFAFATLAGGLVQLFILWPSFRGLGFTIRWGFHLKDPGVRKAFRRMAPGLMGTGIHPINVLISTVLASQLAVGAQTVLFNSNMMGEMVLGIFATSVATVSLPTMSRLVEDGDAAGLRASLAGSLRGTAMLVIPGAMGMAVLARPIIAIIFRTGLFDAASVEWTARTLSFQAVGLVFIATGRIAAQCLYALKDYRRPAVAALLGIVANILFSILLMGPLGTSGIALANGLASLVGLALLAWSLAPRLDLPLKEVLGGWAVMGLAAAGMGLLAWWGIGLTGLDRFHGPLGTALRLLPLIALCAATYAGLLLLLKVPEALDFAALLRRKAGFRVS